MAHATLSPRRRRFVQEYLVDFIGTQAAVRAGYSPNSAKVTASRLLTDAYVLQAVERGAAAVAERAEIDAEWVLVRLQEKAENSERDSDSIRALELIGKHLRMFTERVEHASPSIPDTRPLKEFTVEELRKLLVAIEQDEADETEVPA